MTQTAVRIIQAETLILPRGPAGPGHVVVADGRIARVEVGRHPHPDLDLPGQTLAPGFVDLQINGAAGCDFLAPTQDGLAAAHSHLVRTGTVAYLPTLISAPDDRLRRALVFFGERAERPSVPRILGVHLEGPFLSPVRPGAHRPEHLRPASVDYLRGLIRDFPGLIRIMTLAPELPGAADVIGYLVEQGIVVAVGHTDATYAEAVVAFDRGARLATHLFNAMRPYHHREPGVIGAALGRGDVTCSIIADHVHLHPAVIDQIILAKGAERTALVTDAISAAGTTGGSPLLGDRAVRIEDGTPRLEDGTLAGSILAMDRAVRNVAAAHWGIERAAAMAATTPARLLGLEQGQIAEGMRADLVALDKDLVVTATIAGGEPVSQARL